MGILQILLLICEAVLLTDCARGPPQVADQVAHRQSARLGSAIKLPCPVDGDPPPLIMWTKDGRNIHSGWTRFRILRLGLKIKEVEAEDAGTYVCKATNGFGSVNINYTLIVIDDSGSDNSRPGGPAGPHSDAGPDSVLGKLARPRFTQPAKMRKRVIARPVGSSVRLKCAASGNPRPDIVWLKEERRLTEREVGAGRQKKWTLSLRGLTAEQSGRYTCRVSNRAGEINATYKVEVIRKADQLQAGADGHAPGQHHGGLRGHHLLPVQGAQRRQARHPVAEAGGDARGEPLQHHHRGGRRPLRGAAHRGGVVAARRLLPQQAADHQSQGGGRRHVHLPGRQHHGLQLPQRLPHRATRHQASHHAHLRPVLQLAALARDHRHPRRPGVHPGRGAAVVLSEQEALPAARPPGPPGPAAWPTPPAGLPGPGERLRRPLVRLLQPREGVLRGFHELRGVPGPAAAAAPAGPGQLGAGHQDLPQDLHGHTHSHTLPRGRQGAPASAHPLPVLTPPPRSVTGTAVV